MEIVKAIPYDISNLGIHDFFVKHKFDFHKYSVIVNHKQNRHLTQTQEYVLVFVKVSNGKNN